MDIIRLKKQTQPPKKAMPRWNTRKPNIYLFGILRISIGGRAIKEDWEGMGGEMRGKKIAHYIRPYGGGCQLWQEHFSRKMI